MHATTTTGARIPTVGFGTWRMTGQAATQGVLDALELGYRHVDTAQLYDNEAAVGAGIRDSGVAREDIFLTTKVWGDHIRSDQVVTSVEDSLALLGTPYVDLILVHWPEPSVPLERTLSDLRGLQERGLARHIGVSNFPSALLREAAKHATIAANQVEYHAQLGQDAVLTVAREIGAVVTAYCPLAQGRLVTHPTLQEIGEAHNKSAAQVAIRWLVQQSGVCAIPKSSNRRRIGSNIDVFDFELSEAELDRIGRLPKDLRTCDPPIAPRWDP